MKRLFGNIHLFTTTFYLILLFEVLYSIKKQELNLCVTNLSFRIEWSLLDIARSTFRTI